MKSDFDRSIGEGYPYKHLQDYSKDYICCVGEIHLAGGCMYRAFHLPRGIYSALASVTQYSQS